MKKNIIISLIASVSINAVCLVINLICALNAHFLPLGLYYPGGDCVEYIGFGINLLQIFAFSPEGKGGSFYEVSFNLPSLIVPLILIFILVLAICILINKIRKKKTSK